MKQIIHKHKGGHTLFVACLLLLSILLSNTILTAEPIADQKESLREQEYFAAPEEAKIIKAEDWLEIKFQVEQCYPQGDFPILKIGPREIEQDFVDKLIDTFMPDADYYPGDYINMQALLDDPAGIDTLIDQLKERAETTDTQTHDDYIVFLEQLRDEGLPAFDEQEIKQIDAVKPSCTNPGGLFMLGGKRDGEHMLLSIEHYEALPFQHIHFQKSAFMRALRNSTQSEDIDVLVTLSQEGENIVSNMTAPEAAEKTDLKLDDVSFFVNYRPQGEIVDAEAFATILDKIDPEKLAEIFFVPEVKLEEAPSRNPSDFESELEELLEELAISNVHAVKTEAVCIWDDSYELVSLRPAWRIIYKPLISGVACPYDEYGPLYQAYDLQKIEASDSPPLLPMPLQMESIEIYLNDDGVIAFDYYSPMEVLETIAEKAELLPREDILAIAEKLLPLKMEKLYGNNDILQMEVKVEHMVLGYWTKSEPDTPDVAQMIPVWNFYGSINFITETDEGKLFHIKANKQDSSLLCLNAIDGTVLDLLKGE